MSKFRSIRRPLVLAAATAALLLPTVPANAEFGVRLQSENPVEQVSATIDGYNQATTCPPGTVVSALSGTWNNYLSSVMVACQSFTTNGPDLAVGGTYGASFPGQGVEGPNSGLSDCPTGQAAVGLGSQIGDIFDGTRLTCQGFSGNALTGSPGDAALLGGSGGVYQQTTCPSGQVMTGLATDSVAYDTPNSFGAMSIQCSSIQSVGNFQPDLVIEGKGDGIYKPLGARSQDVVKRVAGGKTAVFHIDVQADGDSTDIITLTGPSSRNQYKVTYLFDGVNVTDQVTGDGLALTIAGPAQAPPFAIKVKLARDANPLRSFGVPLKATSSGSPTAGDTVRGLVRLKA